MAHLYCDKAYDALLQMIISEKLLPSVSLDLSKLAAELDMSITPVRDAIKRLEAEGMVEVIPRCGTFVRHFTLQDLIRCYEFAEAIEGMAGYLLTERIKLKAINVTELNTLDALILKMEKNLAREDARKWGDYDRSFHQIICALCGNDFLSNNHASLRNQMNSVLSFITPFHVDRQNSTREHREIVQAIRNGDPEKTRIICQNHRNLVRSILIDLLN